MNLKIPPNQAGNPLQIWEAVSSRKPVTGLTHFFYRYPACFSPGFARSVILNFTKPGDIVVDPFMGGGTAIVEAFALGRKPYGSDISPLATFITKVKTTVLDERGMETVCLWLRETLSKSSLRRSVDRPSGWISRGYQRNINDAQTWPIRKLLELFLNEISILDEVNHESFARCLLLNTAKWALDCRVNIPTTQQFRDRLKINFFQMRNGINELRHFLDYWAKQGYVHKPEIVNFDAKRLHEFLTVKLEQTPRLILTSPPYPGVHVLYHRWQVRGRRETPAPFWIAGHRDGNGAAHYTLGDRKQKDYKVYFTQLTESYKSLARISGKGTILVQLIAFSRPDMQLELTLAALQTSGFVEFKPFKEFDVDDGRLWRKVPNRKWYAKQKGDLPSSYEVVLFHRFKGN